MKNLAILCLLFVLACQPQEQSTTLSEAEISAVMEATTQYGGAIVAGDFDKIRSLMGDDIVLMPTEAQAANGLDAAMQFMEEGPGIEGSINPEQVEGSGNLAYVRGNFDLTFIINDSTQVPDKGKYIEVWKKQDDGSWKVVVDIWNSNLSPEM
jgi:ketosteroid isomerase-like protein